MAIQNKNLYRLKSYPRRYKKRLRRINKTRERANTNKYINEVFYDLADSYFDHLTYGDPLRDMYGQLITAKHDLQHSEWATDANYQDYYIFDKDNWEEYLEDPDWLEYLGRNWTLEDELDYCDKMYQNWQPEEDYDFTEEEITYAVNSWNKASDKTESDSIQRAIDAGQALKDYQEAWKKYGLIGVVKLYFNL